MVKITIEINDEMNEKFRAKATEVFGDKKGKLQKGLIQALEYWISYSGDTRKFTISDKHDTTIRGRPR